MGQGCGSRYRPKDQITSQSDREREGPHSTEQVDLTTEQVVELHQWTWNWFLSE